MNPYQPPPHASKRIARIGEPAARVYVVVTVATLAAWVLLITTMWNRRSFLVDDNMLSMQVTPMTYVCTTTSGGLLLTSILIAMSLVIVNGLTFAIRRWKKIANGVAK